MLYKDFNNILKKLKIFKKEFQSFKETLKLNLNVYLKTFDLCKEMQARKFF